MRVALIGAGGIGKTHQQAYAAWPEQCEIVAVVDVVAAAAESLAQTANTVAFTDPTQMMDEVAPDAVSICTPPHEHLPLAQAAAQRGIHVLCEKPPARTLAETQALVDAFAGGPGSNKAILQFAFCHRFHQPIQQAQALLASGKLGDLVHIDNRFAFRFDGVESRWFSDPDVSGGGIIIDTLVHSVDIFRTLAGEIATVHASATNRLPALDGRVEDTASLLVTSESGVLGTLSCSWATALPRFSLTLFGTKGEAVIDYANDGGVQVRTVDEEAWSQMAFDAPDRFAQQAKHFLDCIAQGKMPLVTGADGLAVMRVLDAAYRQINQT